MRIILLGLLAAGTIGVCVVTASAATIGGAVTKEAYHAASAVVQADLLPGWRKRVHKR